MVPDCMTLDGAEPCKGYALLRATLDAERDAGKKVIAERDRHWDAYQNSKAEIERLRAALRHAAAIADAEAADALKMRQLRHDDPPEYFTYGGQIYAAQTIAKAIRALDER